MKKIFYRIILMYSCMSLSQQGFSQNLETSVEAETGTLTGVVLGNQTGNSSGKYVTGFDAEGDNVTISVTVSKSALYKLVIRYRANQGSKVQALYVNNALVSNITFPEGSSFVDLDAGRVMLNSGNNTVAIKKLWGFMDVDKFSFYTSPPNVYSITSSLIDPQATAATKKLYAFLSYRFGKRIISGQTDGKYDTLKLVTGKSPLLRAYDMMNYSPQYAYNWANGGFAFGAVNKQDVESAINWYNSTNKKGIISFHWHWFSPSSGTVGTNTFESKHTTFDLIQAVKSGTTQNQEVLRDIDAIAIQLKKLSDANIPILWRPLHEAGGTWFWWGAKGSTACKALWDIMYDRLTNHHGLHNLIWVWSTPEADWYPGNSKVDMIGYDSYPAPFSYTAQKNILDQLHTIVNGKKIITMSENGPIPEIADCFSMDAPWSYFMSWNSLVFAQNSIQHIKDVYNNPLVITLENVSDSIPETVTVTGLEKYHEREIAGLVYPNPVQDRLIFSEKMLAMKPSQIALYNMQGDKLSEYDSTAKFILFEKLPPGMYLLRIFLNHHVINYKIIKS